LKIIPNHISIGHVFSAQYIFRVPKYQRNYTWTDSEIDDFLDDLFKCYDARHNNGTIHHFFGGIVSVEKTIAGSSRRHCDVVDGQQRLATLIILVSCIISAYKDIKENAASTDSDKILCEARVQNLNNQYMVYMDEINREPQVIDRLELSAPDKQFFKDLIRRTLPLTATRESHHRLAYAYDTLKNKISAIIDPYALSDKIDKLKIFENILNDDFTIIHIVTDTNSEAYRLFQVLNDRGTSLTEGDLLRAKTLELLDNPDFITQQQNVESAWDDILSDPPRLTNYFLRWYYSSRMGKTAGNVSLFDDFLAAFFPQHVNSVITQQDANNIEAEVRNFRDEVKICRELIDGEWPYPNNPPITRWDRDRLILLVKELEHVHCMPLLLAACKLDHVNFSKIVQLLERIFFRYKLICSLHIGSLTKIYLANSVNIRQNPATYSVATLEASLRQLQNTKAQDETFKTLLDNLVYKLSGGNKPLKYFLITIEHFLSWYNSGAAGTPTIDKTVVFDFSNTTIEHIYPLHPSSNNMDMELNELVNTLGNLSFLGPDDNIDLANEDFNTKKPYYANSAVKLNNEIANSNVWDINEVSARKDRLKQIALKVFQV
jgi:hypothetical protein